MAVTSEVSHGYTSLGASVKVSGPLLNGKVVEIQWWDWPMVRSDGVVELNAHYILEADDGAKLYIKKHGLYPWEN